MAKASKRVYSVDAVVCVWTGVKIEAASWEDAVIQAQALKVTDFIDIPGTHNDSRLHLTGIHHDAGLSKLDKID
jgi:hypothetical protein